MLTQHRQFWLKNANIDIHEYVLCLKDGPHEVIPHEVISHPKNSVVYNSLAGLLQASDSGHGDEDIGGIYIIIATFTEKIIAAIPSGQKQSMNVKMERTR